MNRFESFKHQLSLLVLASIVIGMAAITGGQWLVSQYMVGNELVGYAIVIVVCLFLAAILTALVASYATKPLKLVWQAVLHVLPDRSSIGQPAPNIDDNKIASELVTGLVMQVYQLASHCL